MQAATGALLSLIEACPSLTRLCLTAHRQVLRCPSPWVLRLHAKSFFLQTGDRELAALATLPSLEQLDILGNRLYPPVLSWEINHDIHCQTDNIQMSPIHIYIFLFFLFEVIPLVIYQECISDSSPGAGGFSAKSQTVGLLFLWPTWWTRSLSTESSGYILGACVMNFATTVKDILKFPIHMFNAHWNQYHFSILTWQSNGVSPIPANSLWSLIWYLALCPELYVQKWWLCFIFTFSLIFQRTLPPHPPPCPPFPSDASCFPLHSGGN